jgi:hypothetical protein
VFWNELVWEKLAEILQNVGITVIAVRKLGQLTITLFSGASLLNPSEAMDLFA